jgi:hypothetical protein
MEVPVRGENVHRVVVDAEPQRLCRAEIHEREIRPAVLLLDRNDIEWCVGIIALVPKAIVGEFRVGIL